MKSPEPVPYEPPTITTYGTVRELTLGTGGTNAADAAHCSYGPFKGVPPSGLNCVPA